MLKLNKLLFSFRIISIAKSLQLPLTTLSAKNKSKIAVSFSNSVDAENTTESELMIVINKAQELYQLLHSFTTETDAEKLEKLYHFFVTSKHPQTTTVIHNTLQSIRVVYNTLSQTDKHYKLIQLPYQEMHDLIIKIQDVTIDTLTGVK